MSAPYLSIALGSVIGSVVRWLVGLGAIALFGQAFPWGTLFVNITGSFAIGFYAALTEPPAAPAAHARARHFFMTGLCGGYTTFSAFSLETLRMLHAGAAAEAVAYAAISLLGAIAAAWLGEAVAPRR